MVRRDKKGKRKGRGEEYFQKRYNVPSMVPNILYPWTYVETWLLAPTNWQSRKEDMMGTLPVIQGRM